MVYYSRYDGAGRVIERLEPGGQVQTMTYDGYNKMRTLITGGQSTLLISDHKEETVVWQQHDGTVKVRVCKEFQQFIQPNGTTISQRKMFAADGALVASITSTVTLPTNTTTTSIALHATDHKR